jgi:hypothetical protein
MYIYISHTYKLMEGNDNTEDAYHLLLANRTSTYITRLILVKNILRPEEISLLNIIKLEPAPF